MKELKKLQSKVFLTGKIFYYLFSLSGFTDAVKEYTKSNEDVIIVTEYEIVPIE